MEVSDSASADVVLDTGSTSPVGGYADGVLGCFNPMGEITLIQGWDWYAGSDPAQVGAGQYDFETTVTHELGHALGLGESSGATSVMSETLAAGTAIRTLTTADLNVPYDSTGADAEHAAVPPAAVSVSASGTGAGSAAASDLPTAPAPGVAGVATPDLIAPIGVRALPGRVPDARAALAGVSVAINAAGPGEGLATPGTGGAAVSPQRSGPALAAVGLADPAARAAGGPTGFTMVASSGGGVPGKVQQADDDPPSLPESQPTGILPVREPAASAGLGQIQEKAVPARRAPAVAAERVLLAVEREVSIPSSGVISTAVERSWARAGVLAVLLGAEVPDHRDGRRAGRASLRDQLSTGLGGTDSGPSWEDEPRL